MSYVETSLIVDFGAEAADVSGAILELDDYRNVDANGELITQFGPGDTIYFLLHHSSDVQLKAMKSSSGTVNYLNEVVRQRGGQMLFFENGTKLQQSYSLIFNVDSEQYGNTCGLSIVDNNFVQSNAGTYPVIADVTYDVVFSSYKLVCPQITLVGDDTYPIAIVAYMEKK